MTWLLDMLWSMQNGGNESDMLLLKRGVLFFNSGTKKDAADMADILGYGWFFILT